MKKILQYALSMLCSVCIVVLCVLLGPLVCAVVPKGVCGAVFFTSCAIALCGIFFNVFYSLFGNRRWKQMSVAEINEAMLCRKNETRENFEQVTKRLYQTVWLCKFYLVAFAFVIFLATLFANAYFQQRGASRLSCVSALLFFEMGFRFFGTVLSRTKIDPNNFLSHTEYPRLYAIATEAMHSAEVEGKIYISTSNSMGGSIVKEGKNFILHLGVILINSLSQEELYNVLLHEFAHYSKQYTPKRVAEMFRQMMEEEGSVFSVCVFGFPEACSGVEYFFYRFFASEYIEAMADSIVMKRGNPKKFASAIAKCSFYDSYGKVSYQYETPPLFASESVTEDVASRNLEAFIRACTERGSHWLALYEKAIQPRNASHPIDRIRREAVGVSADEVEISFDFEDDLREERTNLLAWVNAEIVKELSENYEKQRKENYLDPLAIVEAWEQSDEDIPTAELIPVIGALATLNRHERAEALCDKIIAEETNISATAYPKFFKGSMMLLRDEDAGLALLYEAIDINMNALDSCMDLIGEYVCTHGLEEELEKYRERAILYTQKKIDENSQAGFLNKNDTVIESRLSEEKQKRHLDFIASVSEKISKIYLVEKVVNAHFSTHAFLVMFEDETDDEVIEKSMDKIFRYLDTVDDDQYSLFLFSKEYVPVLKRVKNALKYSKQ